MPRLRKPLYVTIIGAGKVGTTLAVLLHRKGYNIVSVISSRRLSAKRCASLVGNALYSTDITDVDPRSQFILIATPEEHVRRIAQRLSQLRTLNFSSLSVAHTSGVLSTDVLSPLVKRGARTFSLHPIQSFPESLSIAKQLREMNGVSYGFEGSAGSKAFAKRIVRALNGRFFVVPKEGKILYHIACVFASNYIVAVLGAVEEAARSLRFSDGLKLFEKLIISGVKNALRDGPAKALTGPIARGNKGTVSSHLKELSRNKKLKNLYRSLGLYTLEVAHKQGKISASQRWAIAKILKNPL